MENPGGAFLKLPHPSLPWPLCLLAIVAQLARETQRSRAAENTGPLPVSPRRRIASPRV